MYRKIGLLLPCSVVVRAAGAQTIIEALNPQVMAEVAGPSSHSSSSAAPSPWWASASSTRTPRPWRPPWWCPTALMTSTAPCRIRPVGQDDHRRTNEQLLFHMLLGYLIVWPLLVLARVFARLPAASNRRFAALLDSATPVFDEVNFYGSCIGAWVVGHRRMAAMFDRVIAGLHRKFAAETGTDLQHGMSYPVRWDPFFTEFMTVADIYHYPTQHFDFHRRQLTLTGAPEEES